jgi:bacillolysin
MTKHIFVLLSIVIILLATNLSAQSQKPSRPANHQPVEMDMSSIQLTRNNQPPLPSAPATIFDQFRFDFKTLPPLQKPIRAAKGLTVKRDGNNGLPIWIKGTPETIASGPRTIANISQEYLTAMKEMLQIKNPATEFTIKSASTDADGQQHIRLQQWYEGLKVFGSEIILHTKENAVQLFNGRYYPTPDLDNVTPLLSEQAAKELVQTAVSQYSTFKSLSAMEKQFIAGEQLEAELVIYHLHEKASDAYLAWHITVRPNLVSQWEYFLDAEDGTVLHHYNNICQIHGGRCAAHPYGHEVTDAGVALSAEQPGVASINNNAITNAIAPPPEIATAVDLLGISRTINVYLSGGTYFMIDASRPMFNASQSNIPDEPVGTIWTINGNNNSPENNNFQASHVTSSNNNWNNANSVSAHYNGGVAYEYFRTTFNRNSINGQGGNIISLINITESNGAQMDNAFWNGQAMFYGNGDQAFEAPLAKGLDVAGHEMAHGVIQGTANLTYQNESGALNESFADIFGAMIDRNDWKIGEDVVDDNVFPSGAMRDMQNPHNGGDSNDFYWQPEHYNERYTGSEDNGGVHINSGIVNRAFFLFANNGSVGKEDAEQVYYKVLKDYLVASSKFIDLRNAVVEVAGDDLGAAVGNIAADAFQQVGIGAGSGTNTQTDAGTNPGEEFILWSDLDLSNIKNAGTNGTDQGTFSTRDHISRPSVSDNGQYIDFVGTDNNLWEVTMDWATGDIVSENTLSSAGTWRSVAISKDGQRIAAVNTNFDNTLWVFDFGLSTSQTFELYNPTFSQGVTTGDVDFADVLEFDLSGEYVMYDAQSTIESTFGEDISYWDIGFIRVWNNQSGNFGDGNIQKLFSGLPENVSVGNPTFSKNSPYIIAFDYIENTNSGTEYAVLGINLETYDQGLIWENDQLGYPSYSTDDDKIIFTGTSNNGATVVAINNLANDKINASGNPSVLITNATWGVWFATGERDLMIPTHETEGLTGTLQLAPNPFDLDLQLRLESPLATEGVITVFDLVGKPCYSTTKQLQTGVNEMTLPLSELPVGTYLLQLRTAEGLTVQNIVKGR